MYNSDSEVAMKILTCTHTYVYCDGSTAYEYVVYVV